MLTNQILQSRNKLPCRRFQRQRYLAGSRQFFKIAIDLIQTSCGTGVPVMEFKKSRAEEELLPFYDDMGSDGVEKYWNKKNTMSLDGKTTGLKP